MTIENQNSTPTKDSFIQLNSKKTCQQAITAGWITAVVSCVLTALLAFIWLPALFIDAILIAVMAYFIYKKSRVASTIMVVYFIASKLLMLQGTTGLQLIVAIIFTLLYIQAMRATYIWHAKYAEKEVKPDNNENNTLIN